MADDTKSEQAAGPYEAHGVEALRSRVLGFFPLSINCNLRFVWVLEPFLLSLLRGV